MRSASQFSEERSLGEMGGCDRHDGYMNVFLGRSLRCRPAPRMNCGLIRQPLQG
ncbi:MAG: hypothetical protein HC860_20875 [Alkalinema sp. RU_4_3]|nr:hypothetical protein [Alkalinema sp. RU_4_3]